MADISFNTTAGVTINRELVIAYLNTGTTSQPVWSALGKRVEDSSEEYDWSDESLKDILGDTYGTLKKPIITQSFDPSDLDSSDPAIVKIWNLGVKDQNYASLAAQDMLIVHFYAGAAENPFAERYGSCMIVPTGLGGEGGGKISMPINVTYGGKRTVGTASKNASTGEITFSEGGVETPSVTLNKHAITLAINATEQLSATVMNSAQTPSWTSAATATATVADGLVTGKTAGNTIITVSITDDGVTYSDTCTVVVPSAT